MNYNKLSKLISQESLKIENKTLYNTYISCKDIEITNSKLINCIVDTTLAIVTDSTIDEINSDTIISKNSEINNIKVSLIYDKNSYIKNISFKPISYYIEDRYGKKYAWIKLNLFPLSDYDIVIEKSDSDKYNIPKNVFELFIDFRHFDEKTWSVWSDVDLSNFTRTITQDGYKIEAYTPHPFFVYSTKIVKDYGKKSMVYFTERYAYATADTDSFMGFISDSFFTQDRTTSYIAAQINHEAGNHLQAWIDGNATDYLSNNPFNGKWCSTKMNFTKDDDGNYYFNIENYNDELSYTSPTYNPHQVPKYIAFGSHYFAGGYIIFKKLFVSYTFDKSDEENITITTNENAYDINSDIYTYNVKNDSFKTITKISKEFDISNLNSDNINIYINYLQLEGSKIEYIKSDNFIKLYSQQETVIKNISTKELSLNIYDTEIQNTNDSKLTGIVNNSKIIDNKIKTIRL